MEADSQHAGTNASSVGQLLRNAREAKGLSLGEVADRLKLSVKQITAIEQDDYAALPGATFARGFVRNYARYMDMDADALSAALDKVIPLPTESSKVQPLPEAPQRASLALPLTIVVLLLLAAGWFFVSGKAQPQAQPASAPVALVTSVVDPDASALQVVSSEAVAVVPQEVSSAPSVQVPPAKAAVVASAPVAASAPAAVSSAASGKVSLRVTTDSWVSITDADGKRLVYATVAANESREVQGRAPFKLVIGNAAGAQLNYNGQAVDLTGKIRGTTAKLELN